MLTPGSPAPSFSLQDQDGVTHTLETCAGKWLLLFFYPKDDTPGCTIEACSLRDSLERYTEADCKIFGMSADSTESHRTFADKFSLPFPLLADTEKKTIEAYGVWKEKKPGVFGIARTSFLIDPQGRIAKIYPNVDPQIHADQVLRDLEELRG